MSMSKERKWAKNSHSRNDLVKETRGAAHRHPPPESATGLHPVARQLLLIFRSSEGRRLS